MVKNDSEKKLAMLNTINHLLSFSDYKYRNKIRIYQIF